MEPAQPTPTPPPTPPEAAPVDPNLENANVHGNKLQPSAEFIEKQHGITEAAAALEDTLPPAPTSFQPSQVPAAQADPASPSRENIQNIYPQPGSVQQFGSSSNDPSLSSDTAIFWDWVVLGLGYGSGLGFMFLVFFMKSYMWAVIISALIAVIAIVVAIRCYRATGKLTLVVALGISGATFTLMYAGTIAISYLLLKSYTY
jgi:hypothetical protein